MIRQIEHNSLILAIIVKNNHTCNGVEFFTPNDFSQQLACMSHKKGKRISAHVHNPISREVIYTKEVLIIKKGRLRVDFYEEDKTYIKSCIVEQGDVILLAYGGHGFECLEDVEMLEVKQGPYLEENDKIRFDGIERDKVKLIG